jgi:hypothetical protein
MGGVVKRKSQLESGELKGWFSARESEEHSGFGKPHQQRCTSMCTDQYNTTAAIPGKFQEEIKHLLKWGNNQGQEEERNARCYR